MSENQKKTLFRTVLGLGASAAVVVLLLVLMNSRSALSWVGAQPAGGSDSKPAAKDPAAAAAEMQKRKDYVENAPWMAPGIPMVERLQQLAADRSRLFKFWLQPEAIDNFQVQLEKEKMPEKQVVLLTKMSAAQFQCGRTADGLTTLDRALEVIRKAGLAIDSPSWQAVRWWQGIGSLRLGEQDNCLGGHNAESCLVPIKGGGIYKIKRGPEGAIAAYTDFLKYEPEHLGARWLLNLAHMTFGDWPQGVPKEFLVSPETFESDYDIKRFINIAPAVNLDIVTISGGAILEDMDKDGFVDLVKSAMNPGTDQLQYFHNNGDGSFTEQTSTAGITGHFGGLNMVHADYNNDGWPDVYITRGAWSGRNGKHPDSLLRNNGIDAKTGRITFTDVTEEAGLLAFYPSQTATWGDYNNDGWLDIFVGSEGPEGIDYPSLLFRSNGPDRRTGQVTFTEVAKASGIINVGYVKGTVWGDYDNDGKLDLYISQLEETNVLYHNDGPGPNGEWQFSDVTARAGVGNPISSFPTFWFDFDNDGWLDLLATSRTAGNTSEAEGSKSDPLYMIVAHQLGMPQGMEPPALYRNNHDGTFTDATKAMGLERPLYGMGMNFGDLDNDGWQDFYVGTGNPSLTTLVPNLMFRNDGGKRFQDVTTSGGFGNLQKGHGISFADIDNDGDQDVYEELGAAWPADTAASALYLNPGHGNRWVTIQPEGVEENRYAIGSRIKVTVTTAGGKKRDIHRMVGSGGSFGCNSLQEEVGLGDAKRIDQVEIFWIGSGRTEVYKDVPMDRIVRIRQGSNGAVPVASKVVTFPLDTALEVHHHHEPVVN